MPYDNKKPAPQSKRPEPAPTPKAGMKAMSQMMNQKVAGKTKTSGRGR